jgi:hypothetical protein
MAKTIARAIRTRRDARCIFDDTGIDCSFIRTLTFYIVQNIIRKPTKRRAGSYPARTSFAKLNLIVSLTPYPTYGYVPTHLLAIRGYIMLALVDAESKDRSAPLAPVRRNESLERHLYLPFSNGKKRLVKELRLVCIKSRTNLLTGALAQVNTPSF